MAIWPDEPQLVFAPVTGTIDHGQRGWRHDTVAVTTLPNAANLAWTRKGQRHRGYLRNIKAHQPPSHQAERATSRRGNHSGISIFSGSIGEESDTIAINVLSGDAQQPSAIGSSQPAEGELQGSMATITPTPRRSATFYGIR